MSLTIVTTSLSQVNNPRGGIVVLPKGSIDIPTIIDRVSQKKLCADFGGMFNVELPALSDDNYKTNWVQSDVVGAVNTWIEENKI